MQKKVWYLVLYPFLHEAQESFLNINTRCFVLLYDILSLDVPSGSVKSVLTCFFFLLTVEFVYLDLTSLKSVRQFVAAFKNKGLPLHVLVNNGRLL